VQIQDARFEDRFITAAEAEDKFGIMLGEFGAWDACIDNLSKYWGHLLTSISTELKRGEWVRCFANYHEAWPSVVFQLRPEAWNITLESLLQDWLLSTGTKVYNALPASHCLEYYPFLEHGHGTKQDHRITDILCRVRVTRV
jgi:hypothetical protein